MSVSRDSFDKTKNYSQVIFNQNVPLLDSEANELQEIQNYAMNQTREDLLGTSMAGDDLLVIPGPIANSITVKAGTLYHKGYQVILHSDVVVQFLSTPLAPRDDVVFIEFNEVVRDQTYDPNLVDPGIGFPTTQRVQVSFTCRVNEGATVPNPAAGKYFVQLATLHRQAGNSSITEPMIQDDRKRSANTYVLRGGRVTKTGLLTVSVDKAHIRIGCLDAYFENPVALTVPASSTSYIVATGDAPIVSATEPTDYHITFAKIVTDATQITSLVDSRNFQPLIYHSQVDAALSGLDKEQPVFDSDEEDGAGISSYYASVNINKFQVVCLTNTDNTVKLADNTNRITTPAIAIAIMDVASGNLGTFLESGPITNPSWSWINDPNKPIFLGVNGGLTQTPPIAPDTIIQIIGVPKSSTTIDFKPSFITIRN